MVPMWAVLAGQDWCLSQPNRKERWLCPAVELKLQEQQLQEHYENCYESNDQGVNASTSSSSGTSSGTAGGLSMLGKSTSVADSKRGGKASTATATLPSGQKITVTIVDGEPKLQDYPRDCSPY